MNKKEFVKRLVEKTGYEEEKCVLINEIVENTFIIGKSAKEKLINKFMEQLDINEETAENLYEIVMELLGGALKDKLTSPFGK